MISVDYVLSGLGLAILILSPIYGLLYKISLDLREMSTKIANCKYCKKGGVE